MEKLGIGIIGCGNISEIYFSNIPRFDNISLVAAADIDLARAEAKAEKYGIKAMTVDDLIEDPEIDIVLNLTIPQAHYEIDMKALRAGKHVYSEKPLAATVEQGREIIETAKAKGLCVGCAPDTFMGGRAQTMRKMLEDGWIGRPVAATAFFANQGCEMYHPAPMPWYQKGSGPVFDMAPYYLTFLVHMFGPAKRICSMTTKAYETRTITSQPLFGQTFEVEVPTHVTGTIEFKNGVIVTILISFDVCDTQLPRVEVYGTEGTMTMDDDDPYGGPNLYGGPLKLRRKPEADFTMGPAEGVSRTPWMEVPLCYGYRQNSRALGLSDMARAIRCGGNFRANGEVAYHVLEMMNALNVSGETGQYYEMQSTCEQPALMPVGLLEWKSWEE